jgi:hypothetical protein
MCIYFGQDRHLLDSTLAYAIPFKLSSLGISAHLDLLYGFHLGTERDAARPSRQNPAVRGSAFPGARSRSSAQSICRSAAETRAAFDFGLEDGTPVPLKFARELSSTKEAAGNTQTQPISKNLGGPSWCFLSGAP